MRQILLRYRLLFLTAIISMAVGQSSFAQTEYYFRNVETGLWLGPGNDWGAQASLMKHPYWHYLKTDKNGTGITDAYVPDGSYYLFSQVNNGGNNQLLGGTDDAQPYLDNYNNAWLLNIVRGSDGYYTIQKDGGLFYGPSTGSGPVVLAPFGHSDIFKWRVRSYTQMIADVLTGTEATPKDATFLIKDADFSYKNKDAGAWTYTSAKADGTTDFTLSGGSSSNRCGGSKYATFSLSQTINGVPNGVYRLRAQGFYVHSGSSTDVTFPFADGTANQVATFEEEAGSWFSGSGVALGSALAIKDKNSGQTRIQPATRDAAADENNYIYFWFKTADGLAFTPSKVSFNTTRFGTDQGLLDIRWVNATIDEDGHPQITSQVPLETGLKPARNNATPNVTEYTADIASAGASVGQCGIMINLYDLANNKQIGFSDIVVEGEIDFSGRPEFFVTSGETTVTSGFVNNATPVDDLNGASALFSDGQFFCKPMVITVTNNTIEVGARLEDNRSLWCAWDNFELEYLGSETREWGSYSTGEANQYFVEYAGPDAGDERWLGSGSSWGTRAVLVKHPQYVTMTSASESKYTIQTQMTGDNYLGADADGDPGNPYMDRPTGLIFTLESTGDGDDTYYLSSDGVYYTRSTEKTLGYYTMAGNKGMKWEIFTRSQMQNMMSQASEKNPIDVTWMIRDHHFGRHNVDAGSWTETHSGRNFSVSGPNDQQNNYAGEAYHSTFSISQTIGNIPNGIYELTAQGFYRSDSGDNGERPEFFINTQSKQLPAMESGQVETLAGAAAAFLDNHYTTGPIRVRVQDGTITLGARLETNTSLWVSWDNFELTYLGNPFTDDLAGTPLYIRNRQTRKWLGPDNANGTEASLTPHAQYFRLHTGQSPTYYIESQADGGNYKNYLGYDGSIIRLDYYPNLITVSKDGAGYTLSIGGAYLGSNDTDNKLTQYGYADSEYIRWDLLTYEEMINEMVTGASAVNPHDATFLIKDPNFDNTNRLVGSWERTGDNNSLAIGDATNKLSGSDRSTFKTTQTIIGVPNGSYRLRAQALYQVRGTDNGTLPYIFLNGSTTNFKYIYGGATSDTSGAISPLFLANGRGNYWTDWVTVDVTDGVIKLGAGLDTNTGLWCIYDNFELQYLGPNSIAATPGYLADTSTKDYWVIPRQSYLATRADNLHDAESIDFPAGFLQHGSGWKTNTYGRQVTDAVATAAGIAEINKAKVQNTSEYITIHYTKKGEYTPLFLTTNNAGSASLHRLYQRWYWYDNTDADHPQKPLGSDMMLQERNAYLYENGLVMGEYLPNGGSYFQIGTNNFISTRFVVRLPADRTELTIGGDISRYSDLGYQTAGATAGTSGNLTEPSLTLRHIYKLYDAKIMARELTGKTGDDYLEEHTIHFPATTIGLSSDHVPLDLELRDYWFYRSGNPASNSDDDLQNIIDDNFIRIETYYPDGVDLGISEVEMITAPPINDAVDITTMYPVTNTELLRRRLVKFSYPNSGEVPGGSRVQLLVKAHNPETGDDYNLARFTIVFDSNSETVPWMDIVGDDKGSVDESAPLYNRSSEYLRKLVGGRGPVAHIDFDYPKLQYFKTPPGLTRYAADRSTTVETEFTGCSALPIDFSRTSYTFSAVKEDNIWYSQWGDYAISSGTSNTERNSYSRRDLGTLHARPVSDYTHDMYDSQMQAGFLFIDASDLPGTVATIPFNGTLCQGSKLMCTGWMTSRQDNRTMNYANTTPGSVILKVMGVNEDGTMDEIRAFCPGQVGLNYRRHGATSFELPTADEDYVWQQFYFDFSLDKTYPRGYELRVENNCESTNGGDYFLDDIWVFAQVPTLDAERITPLCGGSLDVVELQVDYDMLLNKTNNKEVTEGTGAASYMTLIYLDWDQFLKDFLDGLKDEVDNRGNAKGYDTSFELGDYELTLEQLTLDNLSTLFGDGVFDLDKYDELYRKTFLKNLIYFDLDGEKSSMVAYSNFKWSTKFSEHPEYEDIASLTKDPTKIYRMGEADERRLVFNGSFKKLVPRGDETDTYQLESFDFYHNYALLAVMGNEDEVNVPEILARSEADVDRQALIESFDVRTQCSSRSILYFTPKLEILGTLGAMSLDEVQFCKDTDITFAMELTGIASQKTGFDGKPVEAGEQVVIQDAYFDWWLGRNKIAATVESYYEENSLNDKNDPKTIFLSTALRRFRLLNPEAVSLFQSDIVVDEENASYPGEEFTGAMLTYLRALAAPDDGSDPQLIIHQKVVEIHATEDKVQTDLDGREYVYFVAVPIQNDIDNAKEDYIVACSEPLPFRVLVNEKAPSVREGFSEKHYPDGLGTLSIRIAKSQFEQVRDYDGDGNTILGVPFSKLHIPLRDVHVNSNEAIGVRGLTSESGRLIRLADTTDEIMQQYIANNTKNLLPPPVGTVDYFLALRDDEGHEDYKGHYNERMAKIHFSPDFLVREGYSYTLRMYFQETIRAATKTYAVGEGWTPEKESETVVNSEANHSGSNEGDDTYATTGVTLTYSNDGKWDSKANILDTEMQHYVVGGNNPKDDTGTGYKPRNYNLPTTGTYYMFTPNEDGFVKAGVVVNAEKPLYVVEHDPSAATQAEQVKCINDDIIITDKDGIVKYTDLSNQLQEKLNGYVQFPVTQGKTYYLFCTGSKLGFYGFYFNADGFPMTCEGTMDVLLKIVPDYEVWTGTASNTDWNNDDNWRRADYHELYADNGTTLKDAYMPNGNPTTAGTDDPEGTIYNYVTAVDRRRMQGFAPLYCTNILMLTKEEVPAPELYDEGPEYLLDDDGNKEVDEDGNPIETGFPKMHDTSSPLIRYDFQARVTETTKSDENANPFDEKEYEAGDMLTELYNSNVCSQIAFQPETELVYAHHLNYQKAWVEYSVSKNQWHLLGSPLKDMLSAEWYAPTYSAQQQTTYFENIKFDEKPTIGGTTYRYDRFAPAVYQRAWDKAKAVVYERGAVWNSNDGNQDYTDDINTTQGNWEQRGSNDERYYEWVKDDAKNADEYLTRLTYQPMGDSKANVAVKGTWSGVYNDHTVPYSGSGFSVMPINNLKGRSDGAANADTQWGYNDESKPAVFRLPKEDQYYDIWDWGQSYIVSERTRVYIKEEKYGEPTAYVDWDDDVTGYTNDNTLTIGPRGRLRSDDLKSSDTFTVTLKNEGNGSVGYFLVANPFICGLDMKKFFAANSNESTGIEPYYLVLHDEDIALDDDSSVKTAASVSTWSWTDMSFRGYDDGDAKHEMTGKAVVPARYAFFVKAKNATANELTLTFTPDMQTAGREGTELRTPPGVFATPQYFTIRAERGGLSSEATVARSEAYSNTFRQDEDLETFVVDGITGDIPVVYTLCGRLATSINRLNSFRSLPVGIESKSDAPVEVTFSGTETLGDNPQLYDAYLQTLTPLTDDSAFYLPGTTQNRYFIVAGNTEEAVAESNILILPREDGARVLSTTGEVLTLVRAYDSTGRMLFSGEPHVADYSLALPKGVCIVEAATEKSRSVKKIMTE